MRRNVPFELVRCGFYVTVPEQTLASVVHEEPVELQVHFALRAPLQRLAQVDNEDRLLGESFDFQYFYRRRRQRRRSRPSSKKILECKLSIFRAVSMYLRFIVGYVLGNRNSGFGHFQVLVSVQGDFVAGFLPSYVYFYAPLEVPVGGKGLNLQFVTVRSYLSR